MAGETETVRDVVVVGGGVAGLVTAWELRDRDVVVLEASDRFGGRLKSSPRDPYWLNFGAHLFPPAESTTGRLVAQLGLETAPFRGTPYAIAMRGRVIPAMPEWRYPLQMPLSPAARLSLIRSGLKLVGAERQAEKERKALGGASPEAERLRILRFMGDESFADFIDEGSLHPEVDALFRAVANRLTGTMRQLSAGGFVTHYAGANKGAKSTWLTGLVGGSGRFPAALAEALGARVQSGAEVTSVTEESGLVRVAFTRGGEQTLLLARHVVLATTAGTAARIAPVLAPETRSALEAVQYGPYVVVSLLTGERRAMPWDDLYAVLVVGKRFNILMNQANLLRDPARGREPGGSLMLYAGGEFAQPFLGQPDEQVVQTFLDDVTTIFPDLRGIVREAVVQRWHEGVPYISPGRHRLQEALERRQARVSLAGDYFGYPSIEESALSAVHAARHARATLRAAAGEPQPVS